MVIRPRDMGLFATLTPLVAVGVMLLFSASQPAFAQPPQDPFSRPAAKPSAPPDTDPFGPSPPAPPDGNPFGPPPATAETLLEEIVPDHGPARPPYQLARYDLGLTPEGANAQRTLEDLTRAAVERQKRLERLWRRVRPKRTGKNTPEREAVWTLLEYAFDECPLEKALAAARRAGPEARLSLARLLLAECRFNEAVRQLAALADGPAEKGEKGVRFSARDRALARLVLHQARRGALAAQVPVLPLEFDLDGYLRRRAQDPARGRLIEGLRRTVPHAAEEIVQEFIEEIEEVLDPVVDLDDPSGDEALVFEEIVTMPMAPGERGLQLRDANHVHTVTGGRELVLYRDRDAWLTGGGAKVKLYSAFGGPLRFRLYRFDTAADSQQVTPEKLAAMKPQRTWAKTYVPLRENNRTKPREQVVSLEGLGEGHYLLTVQARYAPMVGACKFCINNVALYLRAGPNRGAVVAVDRRTGRTVPNVPLEMVAAGTPDMDTIAGRLKPADDRMFRRGFLGGDAGDGGVKAALSTEEHLKLARTYAKGLESYARGIEVRRRYPDFKQVRAFRTGADGSVAFPLDLGHREYRYTLAVARTGDGPDAARLSRTQLHYHQPKPGPEQTKTVVWLAQPIHRPGSTVHFKGIVRRFGGVRVADHGPAATGEVRVEAKNLHRAGGNYQTETLWQGACAVSAAGTFQGSFRILRTARMGAVTFYVNGQKAAPDTPLAVAEYRLPTYSVGIAMNGTCYPGGEELQGTVSVDYLTGKPAVGAEVEVVLETGNARPPTVIAYTDKDGRAEFAVPLPVVQADRAIPIRATVMDASGQTYTQSAAVRCMANAFMVTVRPRVTDDPFADEAATFGQEIEVDVSARTWAGSPLAEATVAVEGVSAVAKTGRDGVAKVRVRMPPSGSEHRIAATVIAGGKAVHATSTPIRLRPAQKPQAGETDKAPDRPAAPPEQFRLVSLEAPSCIDAGKPLEVTFTLTGPPGRRATVAVFAENNRLLDRQVLSVPAGKHRVTIPTQQDWAPSVQVVAVLLDGRRHRTLTRSVYVRPVERFLTLTIETDKADYKPGQRCTAVVTATDYQGRPVAAAEISLGVIDEGVYQLREDPTPDLFDYFYRYRLPYVCRGRYDTYPPPAESAWFWLGPRDAWGYDLPLEVRTIRRRSLRGSYGGCRMAASSQTRFPVRNKFETAAHWVAAVVTGPNGKARATFTFPDNLTGWRFTARGVTPNTMVGEIRMARHTVLPLSVDLMLPRGFRAGDRVDLPVVLHNNTGRPRTVQGTTRVGQDKEQPWKARKLAAWADTRLTIPVTAPDTVPIAVFARVADGASKEGDAIERKLVPLPAGVPFARSYSGALGAEAVIRPGLEAPVTSQGLLLTVRREQGPVGVVTSALDELIQYPYGCVEQTMSRFMPAVVAAEAMKKAGIDCPAEKRLPDVLEKGLVRLAGFQHDDGGWGWWKGDATNDFMTAYVLQGLALCQQAGQPVSMEMALRAEDYLAARLFDGKLAGRRPGSVGNVSLSVYAAHALATRYSDDLSLHRKDAERLAALLRRTTDDMPQPTELDAILVADTWRLLGDNVRAKAGLAQVRGRITPLPGDRSSVVAAAALLRLEAAVEPQGRHWPLLARKLLEARRGAGWGDTLTTAAAVRGLAAVLRKTSGRDVPVTVYVDGRRIGVLDGQQGGAIRQKLDRADRITLVPARHGSPDFYSIQVVGYLAKRPPNPADPAATLRVGVDALQPERRRLDVGRDGRLEVPRGTTLEIAVEVELKQPVSYTRLTVPRPCGVEWIRAPKPATGVVAVEERDDAVHFFIERWEQGKHRLTLLARAEVSGTVAAPPPELVPMYDDPLSTAVHAADGWVIKP